MTGARWILEGSRNLSACNVNAVDLVVTQQDHVLSIIIDLTRRCRSHRCTLVSRASLLWILARPSPASYLTVSHPSRP